MGEDWIQKKVCMRILGKQGGIQNGYKKRGVMGMSKGGKEGENEKRKGGNIKGEIREKE